MLMSYALDAGSYGHGLDALAGARVSATSPIDFAALTEAGKTKITFDAVGIDTRHRICRRGCRHRAAAVAACSSRGLPPSRCCNVYETLERPLLAVLGAHGAARHFDRPPGAVAAVRRIRAGSRRPARRDQQARRRDGQCRLAEADRRHSVRQARTAGRHQDQDRPVGDRRARCSRNWPSRATSCRRRFSTGGRCRS